MTTVKKISKILQEQWEAIPASPENEARRNFLLEQILAFRRQETKDMELRVREPSRASKRIKEKDKAKEIEAPQAPNENPGTQVLIQIQAEKIKRLEEELKKSKSE